MEGNLRHELESQGRALLAAHPGLAHRWDEIPDGVRLVVPATGADAFEVAVQAHEHGGLQVSGVGFHTHFDWQTTAAEAVRDALGLVRDLLGPGMRVRELRAGDRPYRWELQAFDGQGWRTEEVTAQLVWNYFGQRSERIYRNVALPARDESER
ncbi:MAG TPA: hypothetical protein VKA84_24130 [Gemmatimonadaceae bacterium]|nr:hypothetical protein [Gemmatimonadaceae bacterium]